MATNGAAAATQPWPTSPSPAIRLTGVGRCGTPTAARVWSIRGHLKRWLSPSGGVLTWHRRAGEDIQQGEPLATLYTRQGKQELASPYSGLLLLKNPTHAPHERQELAKFLLE